jgi:hypothetical protein
VPDPIVDELRRLAGPDLYRRNAFHVSGLLAGADARTTRQVAQRLRAALEVGADIDLGTATSRDPHEIQAACDLILGDPRRRLVHELFAPWGDDVSGCGCPRELHTKHDDAVAAHSEAIRREQDSGTPDVEWNRAWQSWSKVVDNLAPHLESRVRALDDRQLDRSAVAGIERELPRALVLPTIELAVSGRAERAGTLAKVARKFPRAEQLHRRLLEAAAVSLYEELEERRTAIARRIGDEPADPIVGEIERELLPKLRRLDALLPPGENHRTSALHDQLAILLNNCAVDLMNRGEVGDGRAVRWLDRATKLAIDQREHDLIDENRQALIESQAAMQEFRQQVDYIYRVQGKYAAQRVLKRARRQTPSTSIQAEIDQMLAEIEAGTFSSAYPSSRTRKPRPVSSRPVSPRRRRRRRVLAWLLVLALIAFGAWNWWPRKAEVAGDTIAGNAPVGTCLTGESRGWLEDPGKLRVGDCDDEHWGEILGYVQLTRVPAAYPGDVQAEALGNFLCGEALAQQRLDPAEYRVIPVHAPAERWNNGKNASKYENYAACVVRRRDGQDLPPGVVTKPSEPKVAKPVAMELIASNPGNNAPVGTCVQKPFTGVPVELVTVVRCSEWHWAQVFAYPTIYRADQQFPGDSEVNAVARKACASTIPSLLGFATRVGPPAYTSWEDPDRAKYAYCLVHRVDNKPFKGALK